MENLDSTDWDFSLAIFHITLTVEWDVFLLKQYWLIVTDSDRYVSNNRWSIDKKCLIYENI